MQSLAQLNSEFSLARAEGLARRVLAAIPATAAEAATRASQLALVRDPTVEELELAIAYLSSPLEFERLVEYCQMLLASNPFLYLE